MMMIRIWLNKFNTSLLAYQILMPTVLAWGIFFHPTIDLTLSDFELRIFFCIIWGRNIPHASIHVLSIIKFFVCLVILNFYFHFRWIVRSHVMIDSCYILYIYREWNLNFKFSPYQISTTTAAAAKKNFIYIDRKENQF